MRVRKALILAAGFGTRFLPITKTIPKEMLPLIDRPIIHYVVQEAVEAGLDQIVIVSANGKGAVEDYFDTAPELERHLQDRGDQEKLALVQGPRRMAQVVYVRQQERRGVGDAVLCARSAIGDEPFALFFPDDVLIAAKPVMGQLIKAFEETGGSVIAVERVPRDEISNYGIVKAQEVKERLHRILGLIEKPRPEEAPSDLGIVGRYILTPEIFDFLTQTPPSAGGEIQLTDGLDLMLAEQPIYAYEYEGDRYDTGRPLGLLKASLAVAFQRPDLEPSLRSYLQEMDKGR